MIPVQIQPKPDTFFEKVEKPGKKFLTSNPNPKGAEWEHCNYWKKIEKELYDAYSGICAYSCTWISRVTGGKTVEHFKPKSKYPQEAYRWENYRLVCLLLNGRKRDFEDVLDPFTLQDGWFVIDFPSFMIFPGDRLSSDEAEQVNKTVKRLRLNEDEDCIKEREKWVQDYIIGEISFSHLEKKAPFLAQELKRQELIDTSHPVWARYKKLPKNLDG